MAVSYGVDLKFTASGVDRQLSKLQGGLTKSTSVADKLQGKLVGASSGVKKLGNDSQRAGRQAAGAATGFNKLGGAIRNLLGIYAAIQATKFVFVKTAELETQTRSLKVLTGSMETAAKVVKELQDFGNVTPFTSTELIDTAKRLKAFGVDTERLVDTTKRLGDVAGATGADLSGIATAYGQIMAKGRLQGEELLQLQERGIALQPELQAMYKLSGDEFRKALEKGQISAEAVELALQRLTATGGTYANGAIAQSDTLNGRLSTLQDNIQRLAQNIGRILAPVFEWVINQSIRAINAINGMLSQWKKEDAVGRDRKHELQRQAAVDAESKYGRFTLSKEKDAYRKSQYETYLNNAAAKNGVGTTTAPKEIEVKLDPLKLEIPELLGQGKAGTGKGKGTGSTRQPSAAEIVAKLPFGEMINAAAKANGLDPRLLAGLVKTESNFNPNAVSSAGAVGLAQLMPGTAGDLGVTNRNDPMQSLMGGAKYLKQMIEQFGSVTAGLRAYNQGPGNQQRYPGGVVAEAQQYPGKVLGNARDLGFGGGDMAGLNADAFTAFNDQALKLRENLTAARENMADLVAKSQEGTQSLQDMADDSQMRSRLELEGMSSEQIGIQLQRSQQLREVERNRVGDLEKLNGLANEGLIPVDEVKTAQERITAEYEKQAGLINTLAAGEMARSEAGNKGKIQSKIEEYQTALNDTEGMIVSLAGTVESEIGSAMSNAITGLIDGTTTAEEAFSSMFKNIGKAFIDMATQMIAKALIMKALGILSGGAGGGLGAFSIGQAAIPGFAEGGFVDKPTKAMIGEGSGGNEYVIPADKMDSAMSRWNSGARGDSVVNGANATGGEEGGLLEAAAPSQINIEGGIMQFNDTNYIKQDQIPIIISQASKQGEARALRRLQMSPGARRKAGVG